MGESSNSGSRLKSNFPVSPSRFFNKNKKPSLKEIQAWEDNFQALLEDRNGRNKLREFMKTEYSEENLDFFLECEDFIRTTDEKKRKSKAKKIYDEFFSSDSQKEINVDSQTRGDIARRITSAPPDTFTEAQRRIYVLMEKDIFPRFCRSSIMRQMKEQASGGSMDGESAGERIRSAPSRLLSSMMKAASVDMSSGHHLSPGHPHSSHITTSNASLNQRHKHGSDDGEGGSLNTSQYLTAQPNARSSSTASSNYQLKYSDEHLTISRV